MTWKRFSLALATALFVLLVNAHAQTPRMASVNITPDAEKVRISTVGEASEMRVEVSDEQDDVVFQSGAISGQQLDWKMTDAQGERVTPGTYLVTITFRTAEGKLRKRVEQVTVDDRERATVKKGADAPSSVQATVTTSGGITAGRLAKFNSASTITNSIIVENAGRIGIGTGSPSAKLTVIGASNVAVIQGNNSGNGSGGGVGVGGNAPAGYGLSGSGLVGVFGSGGNSGTGVQGTSRNGDGVLGQSINGNGVTGNGPVGVYGKTTVAGGTGVFAEGSNNAGRGVSATGFTGVQGTGIDIGVLGLSSSGTGAGVEGRNSSGGWAGYFAGKVKVTGNLFVDGSINPASDRNVKANFSSVNPRAILYKLATLPIQTWNYRSEPETVRHIGATAQDFQAAFGVGTDDKHIATVDADGVALAAIQGLYQQNQKLAQEVRQLRAQMAEQQAELHRVRRTLRRAARR